MLRNSTDLPGDGETLEVQSFVREAIAAGTAGIRNRETVPVLHKLAIGV